MQFPAHGNGLPAHPAAQETFHPDDGLGFRTGGRWRNRNRRGRRVGGGGGDGWEWRLARAAGWMLVAGAVLRIGAWVAVASRGDGLGLIGAWLFDGMAGMLEGAAGVMALGSRPPWRTFVLPMACLFLMATLQKWGEQAGFLRPEPLARLFTKWAGGAGGAEWAITPWTRLGCGTALLVAWVAHRARQNRPGDGSRAIRREMQKASRVSAAEGKAGSMLGGLSVTVLFLYVLGALWVPPILKARKWIRTSAGPGQARPAGFAMDWRACVPHERFSSNPPCIEVRQGQTWVQGWMRWSGPDCTSPCPPRDSLLDPCLRATSMWKCLEAGPARMAGPSAIEVRPESHHDRLPPAPCCNSLIPNDPASQPSGIAARGPGTSNGEIPPPLPCLSSRSRSRFPGLADAAGRWNPPARNLRVPPPSREERTEHG